MEFFEAGKALPLSPAPDAAEARKTVFGRAWRASELRQKSFDDLHQLWWVLIKERNLLATQAAEAGRLGQLWFGKHREWKCKLSMARIKTVLTERAKLHSEAVRLVDQKQQQLIPAASAAPSHADLLLNLNHQAIHRRSEFSRKVRQSLNYWRRRQSRFI